MIAANNIDATGWQGVRGGARQRALDGAVWAEAYAWLALLPVLFISVSGRIQYDSGPVAFRFTAMEEDSLARRIARLLCSLLILVLVSKRFREIAAAARSSKLILLLPALGFVSAAWSQNPSHTLVDASNLLLTTLFAIYLYVRYPGDRLVAFLTFAASVAMVLSIFAVVALPGVGIDPFQQNAWRGIFGQRNNCAAVCTLFLVLGLQFRPRPFVDQMMRVLVIFLSLLFIVMSGSRTGWLLAALALVLAYGLRLLLRLRSLDRLATIMALTVPAVLLAAFVATNFNEILALMDRDPTISQRTVIWAQVVPSIVKQPWIGYGYSSFWMGLSGESMHAVLTTGWMEGQAQDGYLDVLLQLGLLGLLPLLWCFARAFAQATRAVERRTADSVVLLAIVLLPIVLVENIGESSFLLPLGIPWFYTLIALLALNLQKFAPEPA